MALTLIGGLGAVVSLDCGLAAKACSTTAPEIVNESARAAATSAATRDELDRMIPPTSAPRRWRPLLRHGRRRAVGLDRGDLDPGRAAARVDPPLHHDQLSDEIDEPLVRILARLVGRDQEELLRLGLDDRQ